MKLWLVLKLIKEVLAEKYVKFHWQSAQVTLVISCFIFTANNISVDPHISEPQLSDLTDYPNALLMKFTIFLVHFKWNQHSKMHFTYPN